MQNLLLVALDHLDLATAAQTVCINIAEVQTSRKWMPDVGDFGVANITLLIVSENPDGLFSEVQTACLHALPICLMNGCYGPHLASSPLIAYS